MTMREANRIFSYWSRHPPTHIIAAAFAGHKPPEPKQYMTAEAAKQWMDLTGGKIDGIARL